MTRFAVGVAALCLALAAAVDTPQPYLRVCIVPHSHCDPVRASAALAEHTVHFPCSARCCHTPPLRVSALSAGLARVF